MQTELKKQIIDYMFENAKYFQLLNHTIEHFRQYIYTPFGEYCIGGKKVSEFIHLAEKLVKFD